MSTQVLSEIKYYKIGKTLNLKYDFINRLYEANQKEYDIRYREVNEIEKLNESYYNNNTLEIIKEVNTNDPLKKSNTVNGILRSIRYNSLSEIELLKDKIDLDLLIERTDLREVLNHV